MAVLYRGKTCKLLVIVCVVSSYWNEGDLHKHMTTARRKFMPVKEIARYMQQLLRGLAHLHKHKVVHCDVSPQNVFLRRDREVCAERESSPARTHTFTAAAFCKVSRWLVLLVGCHCINRSF